MTLFESEEFLKMVNEISAIQNKEKTIAYTTQLQKSVLEKYFNVKLDSDNRIYQTIHGKFRFLSFINNSLGFNLLENQNAMYVIDVIYETEVIK